MMLELPGIILALGLLIYLAYMEVFTGTYVKVTGRAILTTAALYARTFKCWADLIKSMDDGAADSLLPIFNL
jgi:hypothetical protein